MKTGGKIMGTGKMVSRLVGAIPKMVTQAEAGVTEAALFLKSQSMEVVPVATGNLRASAFITTSTFFEGATAKESVDTSARGEAFNWVSNASKGEARGLVGYSVVYALKVHENPKAGKSGGLNPTTKSGKPKGRIRFANTGRYKFLEEPLKTHEGNILKIIAKRAGRIKV